MPALDCGVCLPDIAAFYDDSLQATQMNRRLLELATATPAGLKLLNPGRVVIITDEVKLDVPQSSFSPIISVSERILLFYSNLHHSDPPSKALWTGPKCSSY